MIQARLKYESVWTEPVSNTYTRKVIKRRSLKSVLLPRIVVMVLLMGVVGTFLYVQGAIMGYRIVLLKEDISRLENDNQTMEYTIAKLSSLDRIEAVAQTKLGMLKPENDTMVAVIDQPAQLPEVRSLEPKPKEQSLLSWRGISQYLKGFLGNKVVGMKE